MSVHDIQKHANVSIGSIYNHFGGKEGIAKSLYDHLLKEFEQMIYSVVAEQLDSRAICNKIILLLFQYTETRRDIISYILHSKHREYLPDAPPAMQLCSSTPFTAMRNIVTKGIEAGEIRAGDPSIVSAQIFGGAIRVIHLYLDGVIEGSLESYYGEVIDSIWGGMKP